MSPSHKKRLAWVLFFLTGLTIATTLILRAFNSNLLFFFTPTQILNGEVTENRLIRIGGLVAKDTLVHHDGELKVSFEITDKVSNVQVVYKGVLPDLFSEGKGVVARGTIDAKNVFNASEVLAKHDENYMPPEAAAALEAAKTLSTN